MSRMLIHAPSLSGTGANAEISLVMDGAGNLILPPLRVHNHDFVSWKGCRRRHKFGSNMPGSLGLEPTRRNSAFWIGTGVHLALQKRYAPVEEAVKKGWRDETLKALKFTDAGAYKEYADQWKTENWESIENLGPEEKGILESDILLGQGMLALYDQFARETDKFEPVATEQEFSLPLRAPDGTDMWVRGKLPSGQPYKRKVFVEGKMDGVVRDARGLLWFLEHKTYKWVDARKLQNDHQVGIYMWAARRIYGREMAGCIYNVLKKKTAVMPPVVYKGKPNEGISRAKTTLDSTTLELYEAALERGGYAKEFYNYELNYLKEAGWSNFFERHVIHRNPREIDEVGLRMYEEVRDMERTLDLPVDDLRNFPNPDPMRCPWCAFRDPCLAMSSGADWRSLIEDEEQYQKRGSMDSTDYEEVAV